ncbi:Ubiquitin-associated protein 2 [Larimichthys crocea]|uniref:Uncharacterized protein n=1 Tax=Larimichthys crocea TaxID=215358 RepID=A0ACD3QAM7_LARCR|nr:Ubiquitin-associated protein 2 [Larimichthys crocea]
MPSSSRKEKEPWFATNANRREYFNSQSATLPPHTPIAQNERKIPAEPLNLSDNPAHTHNHPQVKAKTYVLAQGETSTDSLSYIMDPLSISLLDVDQQVATASFLQGEQNNTSLCLLEYEREGDKRRDAEKEHLTCAKMANKNVGNKDEEFRLSLLELPQAKTHSPMSETMAATNSELRKDMCFATYEHCGIGTMTPPISEVMLASLQDHGNNQKLQTTPDIEVLDNKASASPPKPSTSASVQCSGNTGSPSSHNLPPEYAHDVPNSLAFSISTPQSESVPELKREENNSEMQIRPIIRLSMLEDLYHDQWRVVQAHWEQLEEMESLCRKEGTLLCQQPDMSEPKTDRRTRENPSVLFGARLTNWLVSELAATLSAALYAGSTSTGHAFFDNFSLPHTPHYILLVLKYWTPVEIFLFCTYIVLYILYMMTSVVSNQARGTRDRTLPTTTQTTQPQKQIQATAEQIRLAQMIYDKNDADFEDKVKQLIEVTGKTQDECMVALHDCNEDVNRAINFLLESTSDTNSWETVGKKRSLGKEGGPSEIKESREKRGGEREASRGRWGLQQEGQRHQPRA